VGKKGKLDYGLTHTLPCSKYQLKLILENVLDFYLNETIFQLPSFCFFKTYKLQPWVGFVMPFVTFVTTVKSEQPTGYARSPEADFEGKYPNCLIKTPDRLGRQLTSEGLERLRGDFLTWGGHSMYLKKRGQTYSLRKTLQGRMRKE